MNSLTREIVIESDNMYEKIYKKISKEFKGEEGIERTKRKLIVYEKNSSLIKETLSNLKTIYENDVEHYKKFDSYYESDDSDENIQSSYAEIFLNLKEKEQNILTEIKGLKDIIQKEIEIKEILDFLSNKLKES